jgi:Methylenetetrahydrofolate reductase
MSMGKGDSICYCFKGSTLYSLRSLFTVHDNYETSSYRTVSNLIDDDCLLFRTTRRIFVKDCRARGINVPILPGIMCISTYGGFKVRTLHATVSVRRRARND